ncbi:MAG: L-2-hydroxyglutarate oxidase [Chloroflexi bacterium]|nr:L-2-hydroxyglutarate oxidase [Chloroflexota bacterium]
MGLETDFLIIGGGIIGISIARELRRRYPDTAICLIDKEPELGEHASGRNSGVLHAGFYYTPDSLKARFTREGNRALTAYCDERKLAINKCGKLVVARNEQDLPALDELIRRGRENGVELHEVSAADAHVLEPRVKTCQRALFSPTTSAVNPAEVMQALKADARAEGIRIETSVQYLRYDGTEIHTSKGTYRAEYVVNAAGLHADRIARDFGFSEHYRILPFKGLYLYSDEPVGALKRHVYPVPDLRNPFLGVHFTVTADGHAKIGPTALPAFWREQYAGFSGFNLQDLAEIAILQTSLLAQSNFEFRRLAMEEFSIQSRRQMVKLAGGLLEGVELGNYRRWGKPGIRAQLADLRTRKLEMDFVLEGGKGSMHVLNAVSPGWTCAMPFAEYVCERIAIRY